MKRSAGEKAFAIVNTALLTLLSVVTMYPFVYVTAASFSSPQSVISGEVWLYPIDWSTAAYDEVLKLDGIWMAYANSLLYTAAGTVLSLILTTLGAYPLSKSRLAGGKLGNLFITFAMLFNAGMIPVYLNMKDIGLLNSRTGIILFMAVATFYVFILRTTFQSFPAEMEEAAKIDGANDFQILCRIYVPLAKPALVALGLFYAVGRWNGYFWAMILLRDENKIPLQVLLNKLIVQMNLPEEIMAAVDTSHVSNETVIYATIIVATLPIIIVYPFIQKHFVKGVMIGSVKG